MHSKSDNIGIMIYGKGDEVIEDFFESLLKRYQIVHETLRKGSDFIFNCVHLLYYICHKINLNLVGLYIDSPDWIKNKKATKYLVNDGDKCFQCAAALAFNVRKWKKITKNIKN